MICASYLRVPRGTNGIHNLNLGRLLSTYRRGANRVRYILRSIMIYLPNPPLKFDSESEIRGKNILLQVESKIEAQKYVNLQSAAIAGSSNPAIKISLWIRNPGENVSKFVDWLAYSHPSYRAGRGIWTRIYADKLEEQTGSKREKKAGAPGHPKG